MLLDIYLEHSIDTVSLIHAREYLVTYVGLLHSLSLYLTPPPQVLLHELYGPNSLQPPFTGVTVLLPSMHCPRTQIYHHETIISMALYAYVSYIHWWIHSLSHQQVVHFWLYKTLHWVDTTDVSIPPNRNTMHGNLS